MMEPNRIWINDKWEAYLRPTFDGDTSGYIRADLATPAAMTPDDGRPCATDIFLAAASEQLDDKWDFYEAVQDWLHGDWEGALEGVTLPAAALRAGGDPHEQRE